MINKTASSTSDNSFVDVGLTSPEGLLIKAQITLKIEQEIKSRKLTQVEAAKLLGIPQPRVSHILNGRFDKISEGKLMHCLNKLGFNVKIQIEEEQLNRTGRTTVAVI